MRVVKWPNGHNFRLKDDPLYVRVLQDQLLDIRYGTLVSAPISSLLSCLILFIQLTTAYNYYVVIWFFVVNIINISRLIQSVHLQRTNINTKFLNQETLIKYINRYKYTALLSGFAWVYLVVMSDGYHSEYYEIYLIVMIGICAGAVTSISSCLWIPVNFIAPPLLVTIIALFIQSSFVGYILGISTILFLLGLVRATVLGQQRFISASRMKYEANDVAKAMERMSNEDPLTGLLNRRGLEAAAQNISNLQSNVTVMLLDLDGFKAINDTYGHQTGDELLLEISRRLREAAPSNAVIARIGGDEFAILDANPADEDSPESKAEKLIQHLIRQYQMATSVQIGACIGVYCAKPTAMSEMILCADMALYEAKKNGRNGCCLFDRTLQDKLNRRKFIEKSLSELIQNKKVINWFQPIVDIQRQKVSGFEALLRWNHEIYGEISAPEIVQTARAIGSLEYLTQIVFSNCCKMLVALKKAGLEDVVVAMNLSSRELASANIEMMIVEAFEQDKISYSSFEIEITEDAPIDHFTVVDMLGRLASRGISIAIDDFGTGFSSLASLKSGLINKVKIDKSFISKIALSHQEQLLVKAVADLGVAMDLEVVVEGVESQVNLEILRKLGCTKMQGYLFSPALPMEKAVIYALKMAQQDC